MMDFDNRAAVVTGAAQGIGHVIAQRLASEGVRLALGDIDGDRLVESAAKLEGPDVATTVTVVSDLSTRDGATELVEKCQSAFGRVDILVNNAGGGVILPTLQHTEETLRTTIDRNLWTTMYCTLAALPIMVEQEYGRIVNLGAESVRNGLYLHAIYNAAKGGVHGFTAGLAREFAGLGITVNTVAPSIVATEAVAQATGTPSPDVRALMERVLATIPIGRPATMAEVASMVAYLASDDASFVTGQVVSVNGGSSMQ